MKNIIEMHASWIAVNAIRGCYNRCKYCFLQSEGKNCAYPEIICSPDKAIDELLNSIYYDPRIPVCLLPETDAFLNDSNTKYILSLLDELEKRNVLNTIIIVTKCLIPNYVIDKLKSMKNQKVIYLSYSGLEKLEPNVKHKNILKNFENLKAADIATIHYFRPLIPQNSTKISDIIATVNPYTDISTITGLKLIPNFIDKISFWDSIKAHKEEVLQAESVYPKVAWDYFHGGSYHDNQKIYHANICALCAKLKKPCFYYGTYECTELNICSDEQRRICAKGRHLIQFIEVSKECDQLLRKLGKYTDQRKYNLSDNGLEIKNVDLEMSDLSYLSYLLNIRVYVTTNKISEYTYNSISNGAKPLILDDSKEFNYE